MEKVDLVFETPTIYDDNFVYYLSAYNDYECNVIQIEKIAIYNLWKTLVNNFFENDLLEKPKIEIDSEVPIMTERKFLVGYFDVVITLVDSYFQNNNFSFYYGENFPDKIFIEVKPYISSFGATLRQLRTYQEYCPECKGKLILFTKDNRFKCAFESQGIPVLIQKEEDKKTKEKQPEIGLEEK